MTKLDDSAARPTMRTDLVDAQRQLLAHLVGPGTWWTGAERREIARAARAARDCSLCAERKAALSPFSVDGTHDDPTALSPEVVDVVHRIVTDPGRLSRSWYEGLVANGTLDPERYVELVSVTVLANALDVFARAIGAPPPALPAAADGAPSRERPASARVEAAWVPQIPADGGDDWTALYEERESVPQIGRALSLVPAEVDALQLASVAHYMHLDHVLDPTYQEPGRALDRLQMELIASRVSSINECFY